MESRNLHDATLLELRVRWGQRSEVEMLFRGDEEAWVRLDVVDMATLSLSDLAPWGRSASASVNEVRGPWEVGPGRKQLEIEMQSGDVIHLEAGSFEWKDFASQDVDLRTDRGG